MHRRCNIKLRKSKFPFRCPFFSFRLSVYKNHERFEKYCSILIKFTFSNQPCSSPVSFYLYFSIYPPPLRYKIRISLSEPAKLHNSPIAFPRSASRKVDQSSPLPNSEKIASLTLATSIPSSDARSMAEKPGLKTWSCSISIRTRSVTPAQ